MPDIGREQTSMASWLCSKTGTDLYRRLDDTTNAVAAYRAALELEPPPAERAFIRRRINELVGDGDVG
jgi:predicted RNA polymerase sigma factor